MKEFSESFDPSVAGKPPEVTYHPPTGAPTKNVELPNQEKVFTLEDIFAHINAVEEELRVELNEIKKVLNKLITDKLNVQDGEE